MGTINRFIEAQMSDHSMVVRELRNNYKEYCWMWYTFPQIRGLGYSVLARYYEFQSMGEVRAFAANTYLRDNIVELMEILLNSQSNDAIEIFGAIDARKLQSSMTILRETRQLKSYCDKVLNKFFDGELCDRTLEILEQIGD